MGGRCSCHRAALRARSRVAVKASTVLLVCSSGGHVLQLHSLSEAWHDYSRVWVTNDRSDARSLLESESAVFLPGPASRDPVAFVRNLLAAVQLMRRVRPAVMITTGADIAVPFAWVARLFGARVVYIESLTRLDELSLSGRLIAPVATRMYVQWPELQRARPDAVYAGSVLPGGR